MPTTRIETDQAALVRLGPTLLVQIGFDQAFQPDTATPPSLPESQLAALVDTGASDSCIDSDVARDLQLPVVDQRRIAGIQGPYTTNVCLAQMHIPDLSFTVYGRFAVVHLAAGGQPHFALLGRDFLRHFSMTYEGRTGSVTISND